MILTMSMILLAGCAYVCILEPKLITNHLYHVGLDLKDWLEDW